MSNLLIFPVSIVLPSLIDSKATLVSVVLLSLAETTLNVTAAGTTIGKSVGLQVTIGNPSMYHNLLRTISSIVLIVKLCTDVSVLLEMRLLRILD